MTKTIRILASPGGEWSVESAESQSLGSYPTEGQAVAQAWSFAIATAATTVVLYSPDGKVRSSLTVQHFLAAREDFPPDDEDEAMCRLAEQLRPSREQILSLMALLKPSTIDYSLEDDELPC